MELTHGQQGAKAAPSARLAMAGLALTTLLPSLDTSITHASLPALAAAFGVDFEAAQAITLAYLVAVTATITVAGRLGDRLGRRRVLLAGIALFTLASLACGAAPTLAGLVAARAAQGLGAAMMLAMTMALASDLTTGSGGAGRALGLLGTMSASGTALGPSLGGVLAASFGWRSMFLVNVPLGALALWLVWRHGPEGGARAASTRLRWATLRGTGLLPGLAMTTMVATVIMSTLVVGPFHLSRALGLDVAHVGFAMSVGPLVAALAGVPAGRLADRFGTRRMTVAGLVAMAIGCLGVAVMPLRLGVAGYLVPVAVVTAGYAVFQTANNAGVMGRVGRGERGVVSGLLSLARNLGLMVGVGGMGAVFGGAGVRGVFLVGVTVVGAAIAIATVAGRSALNAPRDPVPCTGSKPVEGS